MSFITETDLKNQSRTKNNNLSINESLKRYKDESYINKTKIFLSHKHDEVLYLEGAISFLKKLGVDVYVDWMDEGMPKTTSGQTAVRIKSKIKENHKFILLATEAAIGSKWCNWELGLGDAAKYKDHIAILPVKKDNSNFSGSEYLEIYPYIDYENGSGKYVNGDIIPKGYYVKTKLANGNIRLLSLATWLRNL